MTGAASLGDGRMRRLVASFAGLRVVVIGDAMLDRWGRGVARRLAAEAPAPIVSEIVWEDRAGGAANTAASAAALGADVTLVSLVGDDATGAALAEAVAAAGVNVGGLLRVAGRPTLAKTRLMAGGQLVARYDEGVTGACPDGCATLAAGLPSFLDGAHAVIVSDYAYGTVGPAVIAALAAWRALGKGRLVADARDLGSLALLRPCAVTPNHGEAVTIVGACALPGPAAARIAQLHDFGAALLAHTGAEAVVTTLDRDGAAILRAGAAAVHIPGGAPVETAGVTGGGDTFAAALALGLGAGADIELAARLACRAASVAVAKPGTAVCRAAELRAALPAPRMVVPAILPSLRALAALGVDLREENRRVVFTNGCFDILHDGHLGCLEEARSLGDVLIVGVNSDASVRRLKGPSRPVNSCAARLRMLAALSYVDHAIAFEEDTPAELIRALRPHVFAKGGDYDRARLPEAAIVEAAGGEIRLLRYRPEHSTTGIIHRIRAAPTGLKAQG